MKRSIVLLLMAACSSSAPGQKGTIPPAPTPFVPGTTIFGSGAADASWFRARKLDYLTFATQSPNGTSIDSVIAVLARKRLDPSYVVPPITPDFSAAHQKCADLDDGRDFIALGLVELLCGFGDDPLIFAEKPKIEQTLFAFKFWFTDPTPPGKIDGSYYWSENHQVIYHVIERLVGERYPDRVMGDGMTGRDHARRGKDMLLDWLDHRGRFGFSEWHSNVYLHWDVAPLLVLLEYTNDQELAARAAMMVDLLFVDFAMHTMKGAYGVTHGRSYKKDKLFSLDEDTWDLTRFLFEAPYTYVGMDALELAASTKYELPEIVRRIGADPGPFVDRERIGVPIDEAGPVVENPVAPYGLDYAKDVDLWWGMAAQTAWPVVPLTLQTLERYNLWSSPFFAQFAQFRSFVASPRTAQSVSVGLYPMFNFALLREVDTYTWRSPDVMLSSALDYRKGTFNHQMHAWQATLDARALVFTNHPAKPLATSGDWLDDPESGGGYWNGEATAPRSAQFENVAIHIYAPGYPMKNDPPFDAITWEPYTHAYFPQEYFDEWSQSGSWFFGRLGKGYVALFSHRGAAFIVYDGVTMPTNGRTKPFDLRADGGADNVWIVEVGREQDYGSFDAFRNAILAAKVDIVSLGGKPTGESNGFDVTYESPSKGTMTFGWTKPLTVKGVQVPQGVPLRFDNPWSHTALNPTEIVFERAGIGMKLDLVHGRRVLYGP
jgi:hypothetical protein